MLQILHFLIMICKSGKWNMHFSELSQLNVNKVWVNISNDTVWQDKTIDRKYNKKYLIVAHLWYYFTFIFPLYIFVQIWYPFKASKETKINRQKDTAKWNQEVLIPRFLVHECHFLNATSPIIKRIIQLYYHVSINE